MTTGRLRTRVEEVTDRQLEVARLVAAGKTNPEIAEALGITLDGAKYHVSELLGRLGLERREDIRTWYRQETRSRRTRWLRALAGTPLAVAGGIGVAVVVALVIWAAVIWAALGGGRAQQAGAPSGTPTPTPAATQVVERPQGVLPGTLEFGDASDMPEHLQAAEMALRQRLQTAVGQSGMLEHLLQYRISALRDADAIWEERVAVSGVEDSTGPGIERAALE